MITTIGQIQFDKVIPKPLKERLSLERSRSNDQKKHETTSIWGQQLSIDSKATSLIVASSGRGKSTLVSYLLGQRKDYTGTLQFGPNNTRAYKEPEWTFIRSQKISVVYQDLKLFAHLSLKENLLIKARLDQSTNPRDRDDRIHQLAEVLELDKLLGKQARFLSRGEQQRGAIIRALLQPFELLVLDEAFGHLDPELTKIAIDLIKSECMRQAAGLIALDLSQDQNFDYKETYTL